MLAQEIIQRKRDGNRLHESELGFMANGIADGTVSEGQAAAFAMAVFFRGMQIAETAAWTRAMFESGVVMHWSRRQLDGPVLDKHSTGGVGDKVSLILAPMLAACGARVPMISGYGLGHTGGTLDKLEAIPGLRSQFDPPGIERIVGSAGCAIVGATASVAPADRRLYAIRDVTATVDSVPLITASILSKKLAADLDGLVLDVKTGSGAFAPSKQSARQLAQSLVAVGNESGLRTVALVTDMNQVLGRCAGNAVEVAETIEFLRGDSPDPRLGEVVFELGREALLLGALAKDHDQAESMLHHCVQSGAAAERLQAMISAQGGPGDLVDCPQTHLPAADVIRPAFAERKGIVQRLDVRAIGMTIIEMGGGRRHAGDTVDPRVGITEVAAIGETVSVEHPLAMVHAASEADAALAIQKIRGAFEIGDGAGDRPPPVIDRVV